MDKELKEFNEILKKYVGEFRKADESLFNYGVELGRILEKNNIKEHRPDVISKPLVSLETSNFLD